MTIPIGHPRLVAQVTDDGSRTLIDPQSQVAYHSGSGAIAETRHVYLLNSGVASRLSQGQSTTVLEVGLGTGMGLLLTLDLASEHDAPIDYWAVENQWLSADVIRQLDLSAHLRDPSLAERFLNWRASLGEIVGDGIYQWQPAEHHCVTIQHGDARQFTPGREAIYDAIYFDPFAPDASPELWQSELLERMHRWLADDGRLVTYCVSRQVRETFAAAGFRVTRVPGPAGGKREVLLATKA